MVDRQKFGVILFDDDINPTDGWSSREGERARRVANMHELPTDTIWWTNLSYDRMRQSKAGINPWLRQDAYLVVKPRDALAEWGHNPNDTAPDSAAEFLAQVFSRVMNLALNLLGECIPNARPEQFLAGKTLRNDLSRLLPKADFPTDEAAVILRPGQAYAEYTTTTLRSPRGSRRVALRRPRMSHAMEMLTTPVPVGPFEVLGAQRLGDTNAERLAFVRNTDRPCMVEIVVNSMDGDIAPVYGFGNSMDKDKIIRRSWVTHPEALTMMTFADIEVRSVYLGARYKMLNLDLPEPVTAFLSSPFSDTSWAAGVVAETLWRAAAIMPDIGKQEPGAERPMSTWQGAWLKAADKTSTFGIALTLTRQGWSAGGYGMGACMSSVTEDQLEEMIRDGLSIGVMPRLFDIPSKMFAGGKRVGWGGDKKCAMLAQMTMTTDKSMLWNLDRIPLYDSSERQAMLLRLMEARKSGRV